jgi:predicted GTPase
VTQSAKWLRRTSKVPVLVVSNKCENYGRGDIPGPEDGARLGLGMPIPISSEANIGIRDLLSTLETPLRYALRSHSGCS